MNTIQGELKKIQKYIQDCIDNDKFKMVQPPEEGDDESPAKLVKPRVAIGSIPHSNFSLYGATDDRFYQAPYLLISYETARFHPDDEEINVLIQACAYTAASYESEEEDLNFPDNMGVLDVTQMLERVMSWMRGFPNFATGMEFEIGNYSTQAYTYPYNFGYLTFQIKTNVGALPRPKLF